ncbi:TlpA family protein disulfide reductase [Salinibacterium soli]|uniref:Thioredoxin family protein n=1 Tax=Antiquaquibacter soli TaxID=3064523 RepID=A0ABT9BL05_9MICO|nr:thioredoxin family protein [Protaetiibacter sp. WY-16]MDO7881703.1 thioredoxin family protein [Protaetiibacter sp. WY-16]
MSLPAVLAVLAALVGAATVLGLLWQRSQGRVRRQRGTTRVRPTDVPGLARLAPGATLLQFSTEVCAPCRSTHAVLGDIASELSGVVHVDLDVTHRPDLASRFHILQTPTTLILDRTGVVRARIGGAARRDLVRHELERVLS